MWHEVAENRGVLRSNFQTVNDETSKTSRIRAAAVTATRRKHSPIRLVYPETAMLFRFRCFIQAREMDAA
jgi:hypothetical protein